MIPTVDIANSLDKESRILTFWYIGKLKICLYPCTDTHEHTIAYYDEKYFVSHICI